MRFLATERAAVLVGLIGLAALAGGAPVAVADDRVTPDDTAGSYVRHDGTVDAVHAACGTNRRQQQEPSVAVNPRNPKVIAVGAMDACIAVRHPLPIAQPQNWAGYYRSTDAGRTWQASLLPGYPGDPVQPAETGCVIQGDPTLAFDNEGRLFYGALCPVFAGDLAPVDFHIAVATFEDDGRRLVRQTRVDRPPTPAQDEQGSTDKPNLAVDQSHGPFAGNVYVAWTGCPGPGGPCSPVPGPAPLTVARSTDHAQSFEAPVTVSPPDGRVYSYADLAVGPDGAVYLTFRGPLVDGRRDIFLAKSTDGGATFSEPQLVERIASFESGQFRGSGGDLYGNCGDGAFACAMGYTVPVFGSFSAVTVDEGGVHLVWSAELPSGQAKVFVRSSPDGLTWPDPAVPIDSSPRGHQFWPDIASAAGVISVVFYDSRVDAVYSPDLPPGNTPTGTSSGPAVDTYLASSTDGGKTWRERRLSEVSSQPNYETYFEARAPWRGDYIYLSAVRGGAYAVWTDSRDVVPGEDTRPDSKQNGFDVFAPCSWVPNTVNGPQTGYASPSYTDPCLSQGGLDLNIYGAQIGETTPVAAPTCLAHRSPIGPRNIGRVRIGYTRTRFRRRLRVDPLRRTRASYSWCVKRSPGRVTAVFGGKRRRALLVTTTAPAHGNRGVRPGRRARTLRRGYPRRRGFGRGLFRANRRSPHLIGVRRGRVRYIAVAHRSLLRNRRKLRRYLRLAGVERAPRRASRRSSR